MGRWLNLQRDKQVDEQAGRQSVFCRLAEEPLKYQMREAFPEPPQCSLELGLPGQLQPLWNAGVELGQWLPVPAFQIYKISADTSFKRLYLQQSYY